MDDLGGEQTALSSRVTGGGVILKPQPGTPNALANQFRTPPESACLEGTPDAHTRKRGRSRCSPARLWCNRADRPSVRTAGFGVAVSLNRLSGGRRG